MAMCARDRFLKFCATIADGLAKARRLSGLENERHERNEHAALVGDDNRTENATARDNDARGRPPSKG